MRDNGIAEGAQTLCPMGNPIIHSTKAGCGYWPSVGPSLKTSRKFPCDSGLPLNRLVEAPFASLVAGVGNRASKSVFENPSPLLPDCFPARGVGSISRNCEVRLPWQFIDLSPMRWTKVSCLSPLSCARGVARNPHAVSSVRRANGASWNNKRPDGEAFSFQR